MVAVLATLHHDKVMVAGNGASDAYGEDGASLSVYSSVTLSTA